MLSIVYLLLFSFGGGFIVRCLLPRKSPVERAYLGLSAGLFLLMWLPSLMAAAFRFTPLGHGLATLALALLCVGAYFVRDRHAPQKMKSEDYRTVTLLCRVALPLLLLGGLLEVTHTLCPTADGGYGVGQSTYGDLQLHAAITTSMVDAAFPLHNSLLLDATMAYPYLSDAVSASLYLLGLPLHTAMQLSGVWMMALVFGGYTLLARKLTHGPRAAGLCVLLLFLNGGLGFFYTLGGTVEQGMVTTALDNLRNVLTGYYQTPTNQPDPNNLRFVNIICDMLVPQRTFLGGFAVLLPCLNLLLPELLPPREGEAAAPYCPRALALAGVLAGGLPLIHTHSYLALALMSAGLCAFCVLRAPRGERFAAFRPFLLFGAIAAALSVPQVFGFTLKQTSGSDHFVRLRFNWCNNRGGYGLIDPYFWFYIKNLGLPFVLILMSLFTKERRKQALLCGAFAIYVVAELVLFQPNEYDNNKLFFVWLLLCLPMAADLLGDIYARLKGLPGRRLLAALTAAVLFLSSALTVAREVYSSYQVYSAEDIRTAEYVRENTPTGAVFLSGSQHLNPVTALAGRTTVCGPGLYLHYHGFSTAEREREIAAFYEQPEQHLALLKKYRVQYVYVSAYERYASTFDLDEEALSALLPVCYESPACRIYGVPDELMRQIVYDPSKDVYSDG